MTNVKYISRQHSSHSFEKRWESKCEMVIRFSQIGICHHRLSHLAVEEMDEADNELRAVICSLWPTLGKRVIKLHEGGTKTLLDLVVPPKTGN